MRRIMVVEPHVDDAFLSLGSHLEAWGKGPSLAAILTVFPQTQRRVAEGQKFAEAVKAKYYYRDPDDTDDLDLESYIDRIALSFEANLVVGPLGIQHPDHILVASVLRNLRESKPEYQLASFLDVPYALKKKNGAEVLVKLAGQRVLGYISPPATKWRHAAIFKSQAKFFHFNPPEYLARAPELITEIL